MAHATYHFPGDFLWGTATAAYQVEGCNTASDWWLWENTPGKIHNGDRSGLACDWWGGRWREDFDRAASAGQNAHRLSVEWSRIEPRPAIWDEDALDQYREILQGLRERGMEPLVTLQHFTLPIWIYEKGGWEYPEIVNLFARYARKVAGALGDLCQRWVTLNEATNAAINGWLLGNFPPGKRDLFGALRVMPTMLKAHGAAYHAIRAAQPAAQVGLAVYVRGFEPARPAFPLDRTVANLQSRVVNYLFPDAARTGVIRLPGHRPEAVTGLAGTQDFFGLNYYTRDFVAFDLTRPAELFGRRYYGRDDELDETGFNAMSPEGLFKAIRWARQFGVPIVISENGWADSTDSQRPRFLFKHLRQVWRAVNFNWPVQGYFYWTLVDNFEWERGWGQRFGLWELDPETQERRERPSARLYGEICQTGSLASAMVERYAPELLEEMFPG
jgi:beta-glucosidase